MEYVSLGRASLRVSRIAFGCAAIGGYDYGPADDATSTLAVRAALDAGITLFDTADVYGFGHSESILSRALGEERHRVSIATKCGVRWDANGRTRRDSSPDYLVQAIDASLARLRVDRITLLQLHWPDPAIPLAESMGALERCRAAGKVQFLGCCNFPLELVHDAQCHGRLDAVQLPYSLGEREWGRVVQACANEHDMAVLCYNALAQGLFTGKFAPQVTFPSSDLRSRSALFAGDRAARNFAILDRVRAVADKTKQSASAVAIRWVLSQPGVACAIVGARTPAQVFDNASAAGWTPDHDHLQHLTEA